MYYSTITITTKPGIRFQGIEHLKKFASWVKEKYAIDCMVLGNMDGPVYQNHVVLSFDNLAQFEEIWAKALNDPEYLQWFNDGKDLLVWQDASQRIYQVM